MVLTNCVGLIIVASVLSASDSGVTLVFEEDGATNTLEWAKLASDSQEAVCVETGFAPIPPELDAVYRQVCVDLRRVNNHMADGRLTESEALGRKARIESFFADTCRQKNVSTTRQKLLLERLQKLGSKANRDSLYFPVDKQ